MFCIVLSYLANNAIYKPQSNYVISAPAHMGLHTHTHTHIQTVAIVIIKSGSMYSCVWFSKYLLLTFMSWDHSGRAEGRRPLVFNRQQRTWEL